jgi:hypothetical protein
LWSAGSGYESVDLTPFAVKANASENEKTKLNEDELLSQMRTIIMAGHETTANSFSWAVLELARQPKIQSRLRSEIHRMERTIQARGSYEFTAADIEAMPYLLAVVKVSPNSLRIAIFLQADQIKNRKFSGSTPCRSTISDKARPMMSSLFSDLSLSARER